MSPPTLDYDHLFAFESDFVATLRCVPMAVRLKLDQVGIKLTLRQWSRLSEADREGLLHAPCGTSDQVAAYRDRLIDLVRRSCGQEAKPLPEAVEETWRAAVTPAAVRLFAQARGLRPPSPGEWRALHELQRFALTKLSRDNHDNVNFGPALAEFGVDGSSAMRPARRPGRA